MDDTIINIKKKISHTLKIPVSKLNIWCNTSQEVTNTTKQNLFNVLSKYNTQEVSIELVKDFIQSISFIKRSNIELDLSEPISYHQWMKSTKLFSYISNLQTPIDRKIKPFTKETSINYEINPYNLNPSVGDGGDELASLLWCDKQGNKKKSITIIDNLLLLESFKKHC